MTAGTVVWTSPTGQIYRTAPAGAELFPQWRTPACAAPTLNRRSRFRQRAYRIAQARKHNREQRPINEARAATSSKPENKQLQRASLGTTCATCCC
jgi:hypothetical protein